MTQQKTSSRSSLLLAAAVLLMAMNMRGNITAIGVLATELQQAFSLSSAATGLLTSLPVFSFAAFSSLVPLISTRIGNDRCALLGMGILFIGLAARSLLGVAGLFLGMLLVGAGICCLNVLIPSIIKQNFPLHMGIITGLYNVALSLSSAVATSISVPLSNSLGWQVSLGAWMLLCAASMLLWLLQMSIRKKSAAPSLSGEVLQEREQISSAPKGSMRTLLRSPLAWQVAACMGLQSFVWYGLSAWLPTIFQEKGITAEVAGYLSTFLLIFCLPTNMLVPILANRLRNQRALSAICYGFYVLGALLLWLCPPGPMAFVASAIMGLGCGTGVPMAICFITLRSSSVGQASQLSGISQTLGYSLATVSPTVMGALHDLTHSWAVPMIALICAGICMILCGQLAGRDR
ncbi:MAG: MFS transporter, partial [Christensenellaceae bacterium]|nr:MFS transporter [Christensenellaceae bacterium]